MTRFGFIMTHLLYNLDYCR